MFVIWQRLQLQLRLYYSDLAAFCLLCMLLVGILDYGHVVHGCDLVCWRQQLQRMDDTPMVIMLLIASLKLLLILIMTLLGYMQVRPEMEPPIAHVKRRYCRFILMRLVAAHHAFLDNKRGIQGRHAALLKAIQLFRSDARKLYERTANQLRQPIQQMLPVEEQQELELLQGGYNKNRSLNQLREVDIYRMLLAVPLPLPKQ